eukprot:7622651-Alexandrium_andersonii.AAC.1
MEVDSASTTPAKRAKMRTLSGWSGKEGNPTPPTPERKSRSAVRPQLAPEPAHMHVRQPIAAMASRQRTPSPAPSLFYEEGAT